VMIFGLGFDPITLFSGTGTIFSWAHTQNSSFVTFVWYCFEAN
jgi:hypothetical protein